MPIPETWKNYRVINRYYLDGLNFEEISVKLSDSPEHIEDFWNRFKFKKQQDKKEWDAAHKEIISAKSKEYRETHKEQINEYMRRHRKESPDIYKAIYQRRKQKAEANGVSLHNKEYQQEYRRINSEIIKEKRMEYYVKHKSDILSYQKKYYSSHRDEILQYHVDYYIKNRKSKMEQLVLSGVLPDGYINARHISSYEAMVKELLEKSEICFVQEKTFPGCKAINRLRFDFYLPDYNTVIEVDGEQHFRVSYTSHTNEDAHEALRIRKLYDQIKDDYCKENNIKMIRLPFYLFKGDAWETAVLQGLNETNKVYS